MPPLAASARRLLRPLIYLLYGLAVLLLLKAAGRLWSQHQFERQVEASVAALTQKKTDDPAVLKAVLAERKQRADAFSEQNYFYPKPVPPIELTTIFSEEALINGNWKKVGDRVNDATIQEITSVSVTLETEGSERILYLDGYSAASADQPWIQNKSTRPSNPSEIENETP